jgi:type IV secretory pathway component VirB8
MVILLFTLIAVLAIFLIAAIIHIKKIQDELIGIDREQHEQNQDIIKLMKYKLQHDEMLLQHIEILKYLVEQDPQLGKMRVPYGGVVGEA